MDVKYLIITNLNEEYEQIRIVVGCDTSNQNHLYYRMDEVKVKAEK